MKKTAFFSSENLARGRITLAKVTSIPPRSMVLLDCRARSMGEELPACAAVLFTPAKEESRLHHYALDFSGSMFLIPYFNNSWDVREIFRRFLVTFRKSTKIAVAKVFHWTNFRRRETLFWQLP